MEKKTKPKTKKRVSVLMGGPSHEHEVSLRSGKKVAKHLHKEKYDVRPILISKEGHWEYEPHILANDTDVAFIALHGAYGEDGTVQLMLDAAGIPYTGSSAPVSALAMNKFLSGELFRRRGLAIPLSFLVGKKEWKSERDLVFARMKHYLSFPFVVKPNNSGSSIGVHIVRNWDEFMAAMYDVFSISDNAVVQTYIQGTEVTCGVLDYGWPGSEYALMPTEILPASSDFFDYGAKYDAEGSKEITPARFQDHVLRAIQRVALEAHRAIGASGFSRTDMIVDSRGTIFVLEINTIPGLTEESLLPKAAEVSGISYQELLDRIITAALGK